MTKLAGKVALVTGGNSGIGLATAKRFAAEGAQVVITGRNAETLKKAAAEIGHNVLAIQSDVSKLPDIDKVYAEIKAKFGHLDVVFANAGIALFSPFADSTEELFDSQFNTNVKGLFFTVQKALPLLKDGSSIILNASVVAGKGMANASVYSATKAAVRSLAQTWLVDLKDRQIRVNAVSPGPIATPIFGRMGMEAAQVTETEKHLASLVPMGRMGQPEEIANAVLFLASSESSYVNGVNLLVDGGLGQI